MENLAWNIESEYPAISSPEFEKDLSRVREDLASLEKRVAELQPSLQSPALDKTVRELQSIFAIYDETYIVFRNLATYLSCRTSVDAQDNEAQKKMSELSKMASMLSQVTAPPYNFLMKCDPETFEKFLSDEKTKQGEFFWRRERDQADFVLSDDEEKLISGLGLPGHMAWGKLYTKLSASIKCELRYEDRVETVGLAKAHALTKLSDENTRKVAWKAIQEAWTAHEETAAGILNALAGWRHELNAKKSTKRKRDFLDSPIYGNRISMQTLEAMIGACRKNAPEIQKAVRAMAAVMKKPRLDPWDLVAPSPIAGSTKEKTYAEAIEMVRSGFASVSKEMGEFVTMMDQNRWIEARVMPNKSTGAYCTGFAKSRTPRVYMTFMGSESDVLTLAHELGHAYHSWVMRDMPVSQTRYPMTLAETASVFAETVLNDALYSQAKTREEKIEALWGEIEHAVSFLINIPARFEFEREFYERCKKSDLSPKELSDLNDEVWSRWYGDTLSANDRLYWAHKMHFAMAGTSFYNFPYTFGFLFSLSIYARREELGAGFMQKYVEILRDTGRMTAEDLIMKHLGEDIRKPEFWEKAIGVVKAKIAKFEAL